MLAVYTIRQPEVWDKVVRSFKEYDVYWLSGYAKGFQIHGDGEPLLFFYEDGSVRGIQVVMKRDIGKDKNFQGQIGENKYFDIATPYGYGGWIIEGENTGALFKSYEEWMKRQGIVSEFVRFHPLLQNQKSCGSYYEVIRLGEVVHIDLGSPEIIWGNFTGKNRNHIRKAVKNGVKVYNGRYPEIFEKFRLLYNGTMDKDSADEYYYFDKAFYESVLEDMPQNAQVFYAVKEDKVIAAAITLMANGKMNYHLSGSDYKYSSLAPINLLLYEAALWGCANGFITLYLGGGLGSEEDSLFKFKRAFNKGDLHYFFIGKKVYDQSKYDELVERRGRVNSSYFPLYRAV